MCYKKTLKKEQKKRKEFLKKGYISGDLVYYTDYLLSLHHHEILPERLYLITRIQKSFEINEKEFWKSRYNTLEEIYSNQSWTEYVNKL